MWFMELHLCPTHAEHSSPSIVEQFWLPYPALSLKNLDKLRKVSEFSGLYTGWGLLQSEKKVYKKWEEIQMG